MTRDRLLSLAKERGFELTEAEANSEAARLLDNAAREQVEGQIASGEPPRAAWTPWNQGVSFLFQAMTAPCTDEPDSAAERGRGQRRWFEPSTDENRLREHLTRVRSRAVEGASPLSCELTRLDNAGFGNRLVEHLREMFPAEMAAILDTMNTPTAGHGLYRLEETNTTTWVIWDEGGTQRKESVGIPQFGLLEAMRTTPERPKEDVLHELQIDNEQNYDALQRRLNQKLREWGAPFHFRVISKKIRVVAGVYEPKKERQKKRQSGRQARQKSRQ